MCDFGTISSNNFPSTSETHLPRGFLITSQQFLCDLFGTYFPRISSKKSFWGIFADISIFEYILVSLERFAEGISAQKCVQSIFRVVFTKDVVDNIFWRCLPFWFKNSLWEISPEMFLEENLEGPF